MSKPFIGSSGRVIQVFPSVSEKASEKYCLTMIATKPAHVRFNPALWNSAMLKRDHSILVALPARDPHDEAELRASPLNCRHLVLALCGPACQTATLTCALFFSVPPRNSLIYSSVKVNSFSSPSASFHSFFGPATPEGLWPPALPRLGI